MTALTKYCEAAAELVRAALEDSDERCDSLSSALDDLWWKELTAEDRSQVLPELRPDCIKCVATEKSVASPLTVCGRRTVEFTFCNWEHADNEAKRGGRLLVCESCAGVRAQTQKAPPAG